MLDKARYAKLKGDFERRKGMLQQAMSEYIDTNNAIAVLGDDISLCRRAETFLLHVADSAKEEVKSYMETMVTEALRHVFGEGFRFTMEWVDTRGQRGVEFLVHSPYGEGELALDPAEGEGGGMQSVIGFTLWLIVLELSGNKGPILMDEPFHWVSAERTPALIDFLDRIQKVLGRQIIVVASQVNRDIVDEADCVFRVMKKRGLSYVEAVDV